jgi:hypothetical protein
MEAPGSSEKSVTIYQLHGVARRKIFMLNVFCVSGRTGFGSPATSPTFMLDSIPARGHGDCNIRCYESHVVRCCIQIEAGLGDRRKTAICYDPLQIFPFQRNWKASNSLTHSPLTDWTSCYCTYEWCKYRSKVKSGGMGGPSQLERERIAPQAVLTV